MVFKTVSNGKGIDYKTNDDILTPVCVAKFLLKKLPIMDKDILYDPFKGEGAFYNNFADKNKKYWSEIKEGKNFFDFNKHVDWIISNPPYSKYTEIMEHSYEIADNIVYLIPLNKIVSSWGRCISLDKYGGVIKLWILKASLCGFPFGFPACFCWIKKGYKGKIGVELIKDIDISKE